MAKVIQCGDGWLARVALTLLVAGAACHAQGESRWPDERAAGAFLCHADFRLDPHVHLLDELAQLQRDLVRTLGVAEAREPIHLFLFERRSTYEQYLHLYFPHVPARRALYIKERGPGMVFAYRTNEFDVDVRHEGTHALLHADLPMVPLWLDEGLAEYFEAPSAERASQNPHLARVRWGARLGMAPPDLERLEQLQSLDQMGAAEYRYAWAWVHFMLHRSPETQEELIRYLSDIRAHTPPGQLSQRLRRRVPGLRDEFNEHFRQWKP